MQAAASRAALETVRRGHPIHTPKRRDRTTDGPALQTMGAAAALSLLLALPLVPALVVVLSPAIGLPLALFICAVPVWNEWKQVMSRKTRWRALRRERLQCGYDLRESPGRCPECGGSAGHAGAGH